MLEIGKSRKQNLPATKLQDTATASLIQVISQNGESVDKYSHACEMEMVVLEGDEKQRPGAGIMLATEFEGGMNKVVYLMSPAELRELGVSLISTAALLDQDLLLEDKT